MKTLLNFLLDTLYTTIVWLYKPGSMDAPTLGDWNSPRCLIVPLEYGPLRDKSSLLPGATLICLSLARMFADDRSNIEVVYANTEDENFFENSAIAIEEEKRRIQKSFIPGLICNNSITECKNIKTALDEAEYTPIAIILVCDAPHARRALLIWRHYFSSTIPIKVRMVQSKWDEPHYSPLQNNRWVWLATNIAGHFLTFFRGVEAMATVTHTSVKK